MFPVKNPKFKEFYAPAISTKAPWRLLVGLIIFVMVYLLVFFLIGLASILVLGREAITSFAQSMSNPTDPIGMILLLSSFIVALLALVVAVKLMHKRGLKSLFGPRMSEVIRNFKITVIIVFSLTLLSVPLFAFTDLPVRNLEFFTWLKWMVLAVPFLLLQVTTEELVFRGYIQQQLAARFNSRLIWYVLPSVLFGLLHYDPERMGSNTWLVIFTVVIFGLIAADVTARTGNLGAAIGMHFANNFYAVAIVSTDGALSGLGLYKTAYNVADEAAMRSTMIFGLIFIVLLYGIYLFWCRNKPQL
jgi:membrane protease YdiL (CAAX protease family)